MLAPDYLTLRSVRLKSAETWAPESQGLSFLFAKGGTGKCVLGTRTVRIATGDAVVLTGGGGGKVHAFEGKESVFSVFSLTVEHLFPLFAGNELFLLHNVVEGLKAPRLYPASTPVAIECHRLVREVSPQLSLDHRVQLLRIAGVILTEEFKTAQRNRVGFVRAEDHLVEVFEKLSADDLLTLPVGELATRFGCSQRHLNRLFHQFFGFSVAALKMEMRLLKAVSLLRDPDSKVINVAECCGFNHLGLFNTCFKKRFGVSPGQWRKRGLEPGKRAMAPATSDATRSMRNNGVCPAAGGAPSALAASPMASLLGKIPSESVSERLVERGKPAGCPVGSLAL